MCRKGAELDVIIPAKRNPKPRFVSGSYRICSFWGKLIGESMGWPSTVSPRAWTRNIARGQDSSFTKLTSWTSLWLNDFGYPYHNSIVWISYRDCKHHFAVWPSVQHSTATVHSSNGCVIVTIMPELHRNAMYCGTIIYPNVPHSHLFASIPMILE